MRSARELLELRQPSIEVWAPEPDYIQTYQSGYLRSHCGLGIFIIWKLSDNPFARR